MAVTRSHQLPHQVDLPTLVVYERQAQVLW